MFAARHLPTAILCFAATLATCVAQSPATFHTQTYSQRTSNQPYAVDVNNDGILDLVQSVPQQNSNPPFTIAFTVRVANGNGSFRAPVSYSFSTSATYPDALMTSGDFNGDGNVDLIFEPDGLDQVVLFLGKGDGTFQTPKYLTVALPSGEQLDSPLLAADFNGDGKLDLVGLTMTSNPPSGSYTGGLYLIPGDGTGNFGAPTLIYTSPANHYVQNNLLATGDFDGDSRADVAFLDNYNCDEGFCSSTLHVLYNDGNSRFTDIATSASFPNQDEGFTFYTGDLNSDGRTDVFGITGIKSNQLEVLYGQPDRTFHMYAIATPTLYAGLAMADFNGDTRMDIVSSTGNSNGTSNQLLFFLAGTGEGTFTQQTYGLPNYGGVLGLAVGDFNADTKPDVLAVMADTNTTTVLADVLNTTSNGNWGGCAYPKFGQGIMVCAPGSSTASPVTFNASANSFGQLRLMELWVDGSKIADQYHVWGSRAWFDLTGTTLAPGAHRGVMFAKDIDNREQQTIFNFTVGGAACLIPSTAGVNICSPASGSTVNSPVQVQATSKVTGTLAHMQLWVDGVNKFTSASTTLTTSISLAAGTHRFAVVATNTAGQKWESALNATVK